ncbi:hypothetical protein [Terricaulis silvestris]|uniref:Uncharacterized protein n=1 Tax=Terricaulis silvestris TaxID=2686094 RepID=A0A6I6N0H7_9CAUL|nr:hypothetical protein [Terricaulis silvestris]QGZ96833.1 hypothetical protein DSM104635_03695 [Terricaulis silvestris]
MTGLEDAVFGEVTPHLAATWNSEITDTALRALDAVLRVRVFPTELLIDIIAEGLGADPSAGPVTIKCPVS